MTDDGRIHYEGPAAWRKSQEHNLRVAEQLRHWGRDRPCGSGLAACNCRCRVEAMHSELGREKQ